MFILNPLHPLPTLRPPQPPFFLGIAHLAYIMQQDIKQIRNILILFLKKSIQAKLAILDLRIMCPHSHHDRSQLIQSCLFNPFNNNKIHFLFCGNTSKPPILFMYSHYVLLIVFFFFFQKMPKTKQLGTINYHHIQPTICNLKSLVANLL